MAPVTASEVYQQFIKSCLKGTMSNERINAVLLHAFFESKLASKIENFNENVMDQFSTSKIRKINFILK